MPVLRLLRPGGVGAITLNRDRSAQAERSGRPGPFGPGSLRSGKGIAAFVIAACIAVAAAFALPSLTVGQSLNRPGQAGQAPPAGGARDADKVSGAAAGLPSLCRSRPTPALVTALSSPIGASMSAEVLPLGISSGGRIAFVSTWTSGFSGVASLNLLTGSMRPIKAFGNPVTDQADGTWGGRWLVWNERYSLQTLDAFTVYAWNAVTGRVVRLGHSIAAPNGTPWPSPWHAPAVSGNYAAWAQGYGPGGLVQIRLADLQTGVVKVIRQGHVQAPFFDGDLVVWPESDAPGSLTALHAYSLLTGRAAALPPVLRPVRGTDFVATDGTRTAYIGPNLKFLYYSPAPSERAKVVLKLPRGVEFAALSMGPGNMAWTTTQATYLASTSTGRYVRVTPHFGLAVTGLGSAVLVSDSPTDKSEHPILPMHVVRAAAIGLPRC